jgi:hypothetical protein
VDEGAHERLLGDVLGVGGTKQSRAEAMNRPVMAPQELVEGRRVTAPGATGEVDLRSPAVRLRILDLCIAGLYDQTLLAVCKSTRSPR